MRASLHPLEPDRLGALHALGLRGAAPLPALQDAVQVARALTGCPIALVSMVDAEVQWFQARDGLDVECTSRDVAFCSHAILERSAMVIEDATEDPRFSDNPLVTGEMHVRFYAGVPVFANDLPIGTVCVIDRKPRTLDAGQILALEALARQVSSLLEAHLSNQRLREVNAELDHAHGRLQAQVDALEASRRKLQEANERAESAGRMQRLAAQRFEALFQGLPLPCFTFDADGILREWNRGAEEAFGLRPNEADDLPISDLFPVDSAPWREILHRTFEQRLPASNVEWTYGEGVHARRYLSGAIPLLNSEGNLTGVVCASADITERIRAEAALAESEVRFRTAMESLQSGVLLRDREGRVIMCNPEGAAILGVDPALLLGQAASQQAYRVVREDASECGPEDFPTVRTLRTGLEVRDEVFGILRPDGRTAWVSANSAPIFFGSDPTPALAVLCFTDITARLEQERQLETQRKALIEANGKLKALATTDGLTGIRNHRSFQDTLERAFRRARKLGRNLSVVLIDADHFKSYNDSFGHPAGDAVLRCLAELLESAVRSGDCVARYGGEEFAMVLPDRDASAAVALAERVRASVHGHRFPHRAVTVSLGVASLADDVLDPASLIARADQALYASKHAGRNTVTHFRDVSPEAA